MQIRDFATKAILVGTVVVTNLLASSLGVFWLYESKLQNEKRAEALTQNLAYSVDQSITFTIDKIDLILQTTTEELERRSAAGHLDTAGLSRFIDSHAAHMPELAAIGISDEQGKILLSTGSNHLGVADIHDQAFFTELRDHPERGLFVSKPIENVVANKKVLVFARRYEHANGSMAGLVTASLPLDFFIQMLAHFNTTHKEAVALRALDNSIIVRYPVVAPGEAFAVGSTASPDELRQAIQAGQESATFQSDKTGDGVARTFTVRRLEVAPIYVEAAVPKEEYLEEWRAEVRKTVSFLLALLLVTSVSAGFIFRLFKIAGRQSRRNKMFLERASDGVHVLDSQGLLVEASDTFCAMLGYGRGELIGKHISTWEAHWSKAELVEKILPEQLAATAPNTFETLHRRKDGSVLSVEVHVAVVRTRHEHYLYASSRDITERNRLRAEIDAALQRFEAIFQNNPVPLCMMDFGSGIYLDVNPAWEEVSGYSRDLVVGRTSLDFGMWVDPTDRYRLFETVKDGGGGVPVPFETQFRRGDDRIITCQVHGRIIPLASRRLFIWAVEDVTERKKTEVGLRLAASVFDFSHDGIMVTDKDNKILEINPAFSRITGYDRDEVVGQDPIFLGSGRQDENYYNQIWDSLHTTGGWRGEIWNKRKSGDIYPTLMSIAAIRDDSGEIQRYIGVFSDISQLKEHEAELHKVAHFDPLTGLPNRRLLADRMHQAIARAKRNDSVLAICFVDLDGFKEVNDQLGHEVGDRLLIAVSMHIQGVLRADDTLARLGGDEFVILLNDTGSDKKCFQVLDRVLASIVLAAKETNTSITLSGSIGVTLYPKDDVDADTLLRHADQAMYRAKESGKNRYHKFDPEHDRQVRASHEALQRLSIALEREEFVLHYQPKVNMVTGEVVGAEALIRWLDPVRGIVAPGSFLPTIEGTDLEIALGDYVFEAALNQLDRWKARGLNLPISVNVSPNHLQIPQFPERLKAILARHPLVQPSDLQLEIVESTAISDVKRATATLEACRAMGVRFALDDFGTGYSSLTYFRKLPIDELKIDQSFVRDMLNHPDDLGLVASVVHLAQAFNRPVIAEGVETEQHGALLVKLGCHLGQGYGISRPMPADLLDDWIAHWQGPAGWRFPAQSS
jgi:diguanylate cyclase (GGDEF)-like protein/PAS domain S-box-containing protein